jgi:hypothetical protein
MRALLASLLVLIAAVPAAAAKSYSAERFDSHIRVLPGGAIEVVETVVFRFEGGPFDHVFRNIPTRRTDGIEIVGAEMDGRALAFGKAAGQVEVSRDSMVKVRWRFAPRQDSTHTFTLRYVVNGLVSRDAGSDVLEWIALPSEHDYRIDSSEVLVDLPAPLTASPGIESKRVDGTSVEPSGQRVQILARGIGRNGWIKPRLQFAEGTVAAAAPQWQQRQARALVFAPRWAGAAALLFVVGLMVLFSMRLRYSPPPQRGDFGSHVVVDMPPDTLRPAIAGALAANGSVTLQHAMATLFTLADGGAVTIVEEPRRWGQRQFTLQRKQGGSPVAGEEAALLDAVFRKNGRDEETVTLSQARHRTGRKIREFKNAVYRELGSQGLLDEERMQARGRYFLFSISMMVIALVLFAVALVLTREYGGWPLLVPAAVALVGIAGFIFVGASTPLSDEGVRRAERWRAYQRFLKEVARDRARVTSPSLPDLLPFAVGLGIAAAWSKHLKRNPAGVPPWFHTMAATSDDGGFAALVAATGAHDGGGGAAAAGGAAGGGASGAG